MKSNRNPRSNNKKNKDIDFSFLLKKLIKTTY